jgi:hypothetical protein
LLFTGYTLREPYVSDRQRLREPLLLALIVPSFVSALVLFFVLPSCGHGGGANDFLSVGQSTWAIVHDGAGLLIIALMALHLVLHYPYLRHLDRHLA